MNLLCDGPRLGYRAGAITAMLLDFTRNHDTWSFIDKGISA